MKIVAQGAQKLFEKSGGGVGPIDLVIEKGQFISILGASGSGKSTFLRMIAGLEQTTGGTINLESSAPNQGISFVFQDAALLPWKSVLENVMLPLVLKPQKEIDAKQGALHWIKRLNLDGLAQHYPHELSGGQKMRVSVARALITRPRLLLLDEPFSALDEPIRIELGLLIHQIWRETQATVILVTHSITEAVWLGQKILVMKGRPGKVLRQDELSFPAERPLSIRGLADFHRHVELYFNILKGEGTP